MSFLSVTSDAVTSAAGHLEAVGSSLSAANAAAAGPTTGAAAMAADDVSAAVQSMFATYARGYQTVSAQAAAFHSKFVSLLNGGVAAYLSTEIANAQQTLGSGGTPAAVTDSAPPPPSNPPPSNPGPKVTTLGRVRTPVGVVRVRDTIFPDGAATVSVDGSVFVAVDGSVFGNPFSFGGPVPLAVAERLNSSRL